jgi:hypothetical protein
VKSVYYRFGLLECQGEWSSRCSNIFVGKYV